MHIEWIDDDPKTGEKRYVRASKFARTWKFEIRYRRRTDWEPAPAVTREMWETLLDALERRYRRREGVSEEDVAAVQSILKKHRPRPEFD